MSLPRLDEVQRFIFVGLPNTVVNVENNKSREECKLSVHRIHNESFDGCQHNSPVQLRWKIDGKINLILIRIRNNQKNKLSCAEKTSPKNKDTYKLNLIIKTIRFLLSRL